MIAYRRYIEMYSNVVLGVGQVINLKPLIENYKLKKALLGIKDGSRFRLTSDG